MRTIAVAALLFLMILPGAARGGEGDTLITDPDLLVRLGFPRDAKNVSLAKGATLDQRVTPSATEEFGTADFGWTTILGKQHAPTRLPAEYDSSGFGDIYRSSGGVQYETQISMPSGALLRQVVWVGRDDSTAENLIGVVFRVCQQTIPIVPPTATVLGSGNSGSGSNDVAFAIVFDPGHSVDNLTCAFVARTVFIKTRRPLSFCGRSEPAGSAKSARRLSPPRSRTTRRRRTPSSSSSRRWREPRSRQDALRSRSVRTPPSRAGRWQCSSLWRWDCTSRTEAPSLPSPPGDGGEGQSEGEDPIATI